MTTLRFFEDLEIFNPLHPPKELILNIQSYWNSLVENHRRLIRLDLYNQLKQFKHPIPSPSNILNLNSHPTTPHFSISISHCPLAGGYALVPKPYQIGIDIEDSNRLTESVINRISTADERQASPSMCALWVAKEASFKVIQNDLNLKTFSKVKITQWVNIKKNQFMFEILSPSKHHSKPLKGLVIQENNLYFCLFLTKS